MKKLFIHLKKMKTDNSKRFLRKVFKRKLVNFLSQIKLRLLNVHIDPASNSYLFAKPNHEKGKKLNLYYCINVNKSNALKNKLKYNFLFNN